ncbi:ApeA N-terminal domain 1-containing protein [Vibrio diabolicus]|uniref:ApeA N-terminal domain 1-containing protein n=1 Tax=Vibrio diabolicus TaxID=50719 RepID=UPI00215E6F6C|nr:HEPN domain-containing protein [Vibrio diabolicus]MCS0438235.1 hypothetical protein [Vibrio diabolicus]
MKDDVTELRLSETYELNVTIDVKGVPFAAKLKLSPREILLHVFGEVREGRKFAFDWSNMENLECHCINKTFILNNVNLLRASKRTLTSYNKDVVVIECSYSVGYLVLVPSNFYQEHRGFDSLSLHSSCLNRWLGHTKKQREIVDSYYNKDPFSNADLLNEFYIPLTSNEYFTVGYNLTVYDSPNSFSAGMVFTPSFDYIFSEKLSAHDVKSKFDELYTLLVFFIGRDFLIEKIDISYGQSRQSASLYFPTEQLSPRNSMDYEFFPCGHNLNYDQLGLPSLPLKSFSNFFNLDKHEKNHFFKYLKYKRMTSDEEKFLGYFRLLESLCKKEKSFIDEDTLNDLIKKSRNYIIKKIGDKKNVTSFLKGLPNYNKRKYNTAKCIHDFYLSLPKEITESWSLSKSDIPRVTKQRNDITHANDYYINDRDLHRDTIFIEVLLVLSLSKSIEINFKIMEKIIHRLNGYNYIT